MKTFLLFLIGAFLWASKGFALETGKSDSLEYETIVQFENENWGIKRERKTNELSSIRSYPATDLRKDRWAHEDSIYQWEVYWDEIRDAALKSFSKETILFLLSNNPSRISNLNTVDLEGNIHEVIFLFSDTVWSQVPEEELLRFASNIKKTCTCPEVIIILSLHRNLVQD